MQRLGSGGVDPCRRRNSAVPPGRRERPPGEPGGLRKRSTQRGLREARKSPGGMLVAETGGGIHGRGVPGGGGDHGRVRHDGTRTRAPERAASTQALAVVNMGAREPQVLRPVNAINGVGWAKPAVDSARTPCRSLLGACPTTPRAATVRRLPTGNVGTRVEPGIPCPQAQRWRSAPARAQCRPGVPAPVAGCAWATSTRPVGSDSTRSPATSRTSAVTTPTTPASPTPGTGSCVARSSSSAALPPGAHVELATFCSGFGSRWAERRVSILGESGAVSTTVTVWVHVDPTTGRPKSLSAEFHALYGRCRRRSSRSLPARSTSRSTPRPTVSRPSRGSRVPPTSTCSTTPTTPWAGRSSSSSVPAFSMPTASAAATPPMS